MKFDPYIHVKVTDDMLDDWRGRVLVDCSGDLVEAVLIGRDDRPEDQRAGPWEVARSDGDWGSEESPSYGGPGWEIRSVAAVNIYLSVLHSSVRDFLPHVIARALGAKPGSQIRGWKWYQVGDLGSLYDGRTGFAVPDPADPEFLVEVAPHRSRKSGDVLRRVVPDLADLERNARTTLADGSLEVDALALIMAFNAILYQAR